jgi:hypothetical protein
MGSIALRTASIGTEKAPGHYRNALILLDEPHEYGRGGNFYQFATGQPHKPDWV